MCKYQGKYITSFRSLIVLTLLLIFQDVYSQTTQVNDTIKKVPVEVLNNITNILTLLTKDFLFSMPRTIIPTTVRIKDKNMVFFDSLKIKASRNHLTKRLYSFIVVNPDTTIKKQFSGASDAGYKDFSGRKIRKIIIQRLNVFGADIRNPASGEPSRIEKLLNKTHFNTNENIIRKNLLFSEGDHISPLALSDNERLLRQLPYIDDARIIVLPVSDTEADIVVFTKDVYSLGISYDYGGLKKGSLSIFEKNIVGTGHELGLDIPFNSTLPESPGIGGHYTITNISKTFINLHGYFLHGLGEKTYGFDISRKLISSTAKYAGGISVRMMFTSEDLDTLSIPAPLKYNLQDYWLERSFLINKESVSRIIVGGRYTNNNVFDHPLILPDSYHNLQKYRLYLGAVALSFQKYSKTSLIYGYGRTEDIPYGSLIKFTFGREFNEFKQRTYFGNEVSFARSSKSLGYFYSYAGFSTYLNKTATEQGLLLLKLNYFSNLVLVGRSKIRNFVYVHYTRGFGRYSNENLKFINSNGLTGFSNDSITGTQRLDISLESVLFSPINSYGFRFAFFAFSDFSFLSGTTERLGNGYGLSSIGLGLRIRNDNLVLNTLQLRIGYFPHPPPYSRISPVNISGEQLLRPENFDPGVPSIIPYR